LETLWKNLSAKSAASSNPDPFSILNLPQRPYYMYMSRKKNTANIAISNSLYIVYLDICIQNNKNEYS